MDKLLPLGLVYSASWCYVVASYYHLTLKSWSFLQAFAIAMPFVVVEYVLSLHGNKLSNEFLSPLQIVLFTICCYVVNIIILNTLILKQPVNVVRDGIALLLIIAAILVSTNSRFS